MRKLLALLLIAWLASSCFLSRRTTHEPLDAARIAELVPGHSTAKDVVELLGAPTEVVQLGKRSAYRFDATVAKDAGLWLLILGLYDSDTRSDRLWVFFDEHEVLTHVGATLSADHADYSLPWSKRDTE